MLIIIVTLLAGLIGLKLPDIDLAPVTFLRHRSAWTHGPLPAFLILYLDVRYPYWHLAWMAMLAGVAIHLLADCFPKRWHGMALINFRPIRRTLKPMPSFILMLVSSIFTAHQCWMRF